MTTTDLINPLKELRLELRYTPEQLSKEADIQLAAIGQAEEGFYPNPLPSILNALGIISGSNHETEVIKAYHKYQVLKRQSNGPATNNSRLTLRPVFSLDENPLLSWRKQSGLATYGFCSAFCIHMPTVNNFEKNIIKLTEVPPKGILLPLTQAGYNLIDGLLDEFIEASQLFKATILNRSRAINNLPLVSVA